MEVGVSIERAKLLIRENKLNLSSETISLENANGRLLAEGLYSKVHDPRFDNSAMDGWAVKKSDCQSDSEVVLKIVGAIQAGAEQTISIESGEACKITTGARIPEGADAIVIVEDSRVDGNNVVITGPARKSFIRIKGENLHRGKLALSEGTYLGPSAISLAATMGHDKVTVYRKPIIGIISTGDELVMPNSEINDWQIFESNSFGIASLVEKMGGIPKRYGIVTDSINQLRETLDSAVEDCDALITTGGVSMGDWDIVRKIMESEGDIIFWRVNMRPGGPPIFGKWKNKPLFGLPGNPVSSHLVFLMLVCPWFSATYLIEETALPNLGKKVRVKMKNSVRGAKNKLCLRRIRIVSEKDDLQASTHTHQGSGNIHSMVAHNGVTLLPPNIDAEIDDVIDAFWFN
jgi:molybdopterin molybdotransferase